MKLNPAPLLGLTVALAFAPISASAKTHDAAPTTKLQRCGEGTCLMVKGRCADPSAAVLIEKHEVAVSGAKRWRVVLPLQTVRNWSPPNARSIAVEIAGDDRKQMQAKLPIGVFGGNTELAFLSVSAK